MKPVRRTFPLNLNAYPRRPRSRCGITEMCHESFPPPKYPDVNFLHFLHHHYPYQHDPRSIIKCKRAAHSTPYVTRYPSARNGGIAGSKFQSHPVDQARRLGIILPTPLRNRDIQRLDLVRRENSMRNRFKGRKLKLAKEISERLFLSSLFSSYTH